LNAIPTLFALDAVFVLCILWGVYRKSRCKSGQRRGPGL
jgi:hypothetical protein